MGWNYSLRGDWCSAVAMLDATDNAEMESNRAKRRSLSLPAIPAGEAQGMEVLQVGEI